MHFWEFFLGKFLLEKSTKNAGVRAIKKLAIAVGELAITDRELGKRQNKRSLLALSTSRKKLSYS
jgi:hypothetical protein